jgi:hypothetical protein
MKFEVNTPHAKRLFKMSPVPKRIPKLLYHVTNQKAKESIMKAGIRPHPLFGEIYLAESIHDALMFAKTYRSYVISIDTSELDRLLIRESEDHERKIFDCDCYRYFKTIPMAAIVEIVEVQQTPYIHTLQGKVLHVPAN